MRLNFWGAAADGVPEEAKAEACYEIAMGHNALDEGPLTIIPCPTCRRGTTRTRSSSRRPCEFGPLQYKLPLPRTSWTR